MSLQEKVGQKKNSSLKLYGCENQMRTMNHCLLKEKERIKDKELKLKQLVASNQVKEQLKTDDSTLQHKPEKIVLEQKL